jgi:aryl-alcohol dehydrogenase-like predicted oxidoreductase
MQYRQLGKAGVKVSVIGLGTNQFGGKTEQAEVNSIIDFAIDAGINFIDTANMYQQGRSETALGIALQGKWDKVVLATKVFWKVGDGVNDGGLSRYHIMNEVENSLRRLQTDHIDLYQMHRWDEDTPIEELLRALDDLISAGKIRYIGTSNWASWQLAHANLLAEVKGWHRFVTEQGHFHLLERDVEREMLPYCQAHGVGFIPFFPLAGGFLTGKYKRGKAAPAGSRGEQSTYVQAYLTEANFDIVEKLTAWAEARDHTMAELAHAWLLASPVVCSVISGATKLAHIQQNVKSAAWQLSSEELETINKILAG